MSRIHHPIRITLLSNVFTDDTTRNIGTTYLPFTTRAKDYKEKDKLDSKQISDSAFGGHLSFCQKQETIQLFKIKLKTHSSNSGLTGSWRTLYPAGENVNKIGTQYNVESEGPENAIQCYMQ